MNVTARRFFTSGFFFWLLFGGLACWYLTPLRKKLKFGIDLVGGTYITLRVQTEKAIEHELREKVPAFLETLKGVEHQEPTSYNIENKTITMNFASSAEAMSAHKALHDDLLELSAVTEGSALIVKLTPQREKFIERWAVDSDIEVLRTRLNSIGVEEIQVKSQGDSDIVVELPDVQDPQRAKELIGTAALLEFKIVEKQAATRDMLLDEFGGQLPSGMTVVPYTLHGTKGYVLVSDYAEVTGRHLQDSQPGVGGKFQTEPAVNFTFNTEGGKKFHALTSENVGRSLVALLDGKVISLANIREAISNSGQISGSFSPEEVKELSIMFKSGAFVAPVSFQDERRVNPTLGYESIKSGVISCAVGLLLLLIFSVIFYKLAGLFAVLALMYNLLLMLVAMALFRATLTLSGIAGMILTIGMAVDASILIYERIKELLAAGHPVRAAVNDGFKGAMVVIADSNITTFLTGFVLYIFGTGPVKGFAITLMIGIFATIIAGLFFLRSLFHVFLMRTNVQKISI